MELTQRNSMSFSERKKILFHHCGGVLHRSASTSEAHAVVFLTLYLYMHPLTYRYLNFYFAKCLKF